MQWAEEQTKGYKYLANIEDGKIEVWLYTDQRFDDLVSPPVNDPLRDIKILGMRLAEDFPLIEDMRRFKSQLYNDSELIMAYFHDVAEVSYNEFYNPAGNSLQLRDLWEWHGFINEALYDMLATRAPNGKLLVMMCVLFVCLQNRQADRQACSQPSRHAGQQMNDSFVS